MSNQLFLTERYCTVYNWNKSVAMVRICLNWKDFSSLCETIDIEFNVSKVEYCLQRKIVYVPFNFASDRVDCSIHNESEIIYAKIIVENNTKIERSKLKMQIWKNYGFFRGANIRIIHSKNVLFYRILSAFKGQY